MQRVVGDLLAVEGQGEGDCPRVAHVLLLLAPAHLVHQSHQVPPELTQITTLFYHEILVHKKIIELARYRTDTKNKIFVLFCARGSAKKLPYLKVIRHAVSSESIFLNRRINNDL